MALDGSGRYNLDTIMYPFRYLSVLGGLETSLSSSLPVSFNKSISWQYGSGAIRGEVLHGIKVAFTRTKSRKRTTLEQGGRHHGLDNIMDDRNGCRLFGSPLPSFYLERAEPHFPA